MNVIAILAVHKHFNHNIDAGGGFHYNQLRITQSGHQAGLTREVNLNGFIIFVKQPVHNVNFMNQCFINSLWRFVFWHRAGIVMTSMNH
ncbi:Uncharacterised protein [Salmonella enterica subsp. enterica serovar Bovismorbificans]|nr:Uncharacterised protein [Salmonella enterica subsp. enterica serovar Bovismorbificans]